MASRIAVAAKPRAVCACIGAILVEKGQGVRSQGTGKVGSKVWLATWRLRLPCSPAKPQLVLQVWLAALRPANASLDSMHMDYADGMV